MFGFYIQHFDTVELNTTFYRLPPIKAVTAWASCTPHHFLFTAKGSRFITHMKKLKDPDMALDRFFEHLAPLGRKLAFCAWDLAGQASPVQITSDWTYVRLHGPGPGPYQGSYSRTVLKRWGQRIDDWSQELKAIFVYFDNDLQGFAAHDALALRRLVKRHDPDIISAAGVHRSSSKAG
jgi:uncharacterized protein YecE (DUF72 family)